nr:transposase, Ptta/En/Spm, transposase, Tnp1/En/Spm-like protein [Tanacetum cinerariifolium]
MVDSGGSDGGLIGRLDPAKVKAIKESKDLISLSLDELIENLKVYEMIIRKDYEIVKVKEERKYLASKAKKESSNEKCSTSGSEDEEYAMAVRDFKKFFKLRGRFVSQPQNDKKMFPRSHDDKKDKNQRAFVEGSWSDSGKEDNEKVKDKTCLVAQASSEAMKNYNPDLITASEKRMFQLHELDELKHQVYENSHLYKTLSRWPLTMNILPAFPYSLTYPDGYWCFTTYGPSQRDMSLVV